MNTRSIVLVLELERGRQINNFIFASDSAQRNIMLDSGMAGFIVYLLYQLIYYSLLMFIMPIHINIDI